MSVVYAVEAVVRSLSSWLYFSTPLQLLFMLSPFLYSLFFPVLLQLRCVIFNLLGFVNNYRWNVDLVLVVMVYFLSVILFLILY